MCGEIFSKTKKVTVFLWGITDPKFAVAKGIIGATPTHLNDFTAAALFIASTLNITLNNSQNKQRNIRANKSKGKGGSKYKGGKCLGQSIKPITKS
jgi:hypothetical protein